MNHYCQCGWLDESLLRWPGKKIVFSSLGQQRRRGPVFECDAAVMAVCYGLAALATLIAVFALFRT